MASIAGYTVTAWPSGRLETSSRQVATLEPLPGQTGVAFVLGGYLSPESECVTAVDVSTVRGDAEQLEERYKALIGTPAVIIDSIGKTWSDVMVKGCRTTVAYNGATGKYRLYAVWTFQPTATEPTNAA